MDKLTPEQVAELRAAVDAHFRADEHGALALGLAFAQARQDLTAAIARAEAAEEERDEIVSAIIGHDDEDMKHDLKSVAQLVKDVLVERDAAIARAEAAEARLAECGRAGCPTARDERCDHAKGGG